MDNFFEMQSICMGTVIEQKVYGKNAYEVAKTVENVLKRLEDLLSFFISSSEVSKLNSSAGKDKVTLSSETLYILKKAKFFSNLSEGAFDVTIAPLVKQWGIFTENERIPSQSEIEHTLKLVNYKEISIENPSNAASLAKTGQMIDLGAIAKGYAADKAKEIYKEHGIKSAFINIGGNVHVLGNKPDNSLWKIGLQHPSKKRGTCIAVIILSDKSMVTSGDYERNFEKDNIKYHHILDPRTGYPSDSGIISATVVSKYSIDADALSTAIFIQGLEKGVDIINKLKETEAIFITKEKEIYITKGLKDNFILTDIDNEFSCFAI
ncbi:MAG: FAD:protein FMN transferase [Clostridiaceae bacterium]